MPGSTLNVHLIFVDAWDIARHPNPANQPVSPVTANSTLDWLEKTLKASKGVSSFPLFMLRDGLIVLCRLLEVCLLPLPDLLRGRLGSLRFGTVFLVPSFAAPIYLYRLPQAMVQRVVPLLVKYGVDGYFSAHEQNLQHVRVSGTSFDCHRTSSP